MDFVKSMQMHPCVAKLKRQEEFLQWNLEMRGYYTLDDALPTKAACHIFEEIAKPEFKTGSGHLAKRTSMAY